MSTPRKPPTRHARALRGKANRWKAGRPGGGTHIELATAIKDEHAAFGGAGRSGLDHAYQAGVLLEQAKAQLKQGEWTFWVESHVPVVGLRMAQMYMRIAEHWPKIKAKAKSVSLLTITQALTLVSSKQPKALPAAVADVDVDGEDQQDQREDAEDLQDAAEEPKAPEGQQDPQDAPQDRQTPHTLFDEVAPEEYAALAAELPPAADPPPIDRRARLPHYREQAESLMHQCLQTMSDLDALGGDWGRASEELAERAAKLARAAADCGGGGS